MFPYMAQAKEHNLSVIILNPNQTSYIDHQSMNTNDTTFYEEINSNKKHEDNDNTIPNNIQQVSIVCENQDNQIVDIINQQNSTNNENNKIIDEHSSFQNEILSFYLSSEPLPHLSTIKIPNLSTSREHTLYVYDRIISKCPANKFYVVAHSAGGDNLMYLLRKRQNILLPMLAKIAFTDSVHSLLPFESNEIKTFMKTNAIHFVSDDQPMGTPVNYAYDFSQRTICREVSAGHWKHEYTSGCCVNGVFQFFFPSNHTDDEIDTIKL